MPQYQTYQPGQMQTTDYASLINQGYNQQQQNYQTKMAQQAAMYGGLFGLGSAALMGRP